MEGRHGGGVQLCRGETDVEMEIVKNRRQVWRCSAGMQMCVQVVQVSGGRWTLEYMIGAGDRR